MVYIKNSTQSIIDDNIQGLLRINPNLYQLGKSRILYNSLQDSSVIPILSGGGSGHDPAHYGYIGQGMLSAAIAGDLFTPPSYSEILEAIRFLNKGNGVFIIIKNFEADLQEFSKAINIAREEGIPVKYIVSYDGISVETTNFHLRHRGVAGTILLHKILGHAAQNGASLDELEQIGLKLSSHIATLGVATKPATLPTNNKPMFSLTESNISFGIGINGEPGYKVEPFISSEILANELINKIKRHFRWKDGDRYAVLINNLGGTTQIELNIFTNDVLQLLEVEGIKVEFLKVGTFITSLDMSGVSLTLCQLDDDYWLNALNSPTTAQAWN